MGIILFIIATILWIPLTVINWVVVAFKYGLSNCYFLETAVDIDRFGNRNFRALLNLVFQKQGYEFGNVGETISSALGKNERDKTLTKFGVFFCKFLDFFDENHCKNSINNNI